ncbi:hypothetical protein Forpe1208_v009816 [Fusarium oxysporum f. sp. rapae]|uniref:Uncharacterized protein n=1 Tax=Fusarium oxysporum f. sp. rapae TaxID=485398 RepID=A0A8J5NST9_FUSOX|nr:hypothetical protein Forpe1208_v009816 [Fusarium oxysporum f. sp. rapae]
MSDARNNKRRAPGNHANEPEKKKGRPSQADLDSHAERDAMNQVQARRMLRRHPAVRSTGDDDRFDYENLVSWRIEEHWDEEDEAAVDEQWDQSELKESTKDLNSPQYASLFKLFRISLRLFETAPNAIISPLFALRYQAVSKNSLSNEWVMSMTFCEHPMKLMVDPCWEQDRKLLVLALQWTVICRLDSRRRWLSGGFPKSCPVLQPLFEEIQDYEAKRLSLSYHEMHEQARNRAIREGKSPSEFSDLLYQVGEAVHEDKKLRPKVEPGFDNLWGVVVLPLTNWDLRVLSNAVNSTKFRPEWSYSVQDALKGWKAEISGHELPTQDKLSLVYRLSQKNVFRHIRVMLRQPLTDADDGIHRPEPDQVNQNNDSEQDMNFLPRRIHHRPVANDAIVEKSGPVDANDSDSPLDIQHWSDGDDNDIDIGSTFGAGVEAGFEEFDPASRESAEYRRHVSNVSETLPQQPHASPINDSHQDNRILSEISELRKENLELRKSQQRLHKLVEEGQKRQKELMLSMQARLEELSQRNPAPNVQQDNQQTTALFNKPATTPESVLDTPNLWYLLD